MTADVDHLVVAAASNEQGVAGCEATLGIDAGRPLAASRETPQGRLQWQILVRDDGKLLQGGALPTLIQWQDRTPPRPCPPAASNCAPCNWPVCRRQRGRVLALRHVTQTDVGPALRALLHTPKGEIVLETR